MFENILIIALAYMLAVLGAEKYRRLCAKFEKWQEKRAFYRDFNARKKKIKEQNLQYVLDCIGLKIEEDYKYFNNLSRPDDKKLARMMKREYEQMKDYGMLDDMNRCKYEITL